MADGDGGLHDIRAGRLAEPLGAQQRREAPADQELVPAAAVLLQQRDGLSGRAEPRPQARRLDLHQRHQAVHLGVTRAELGQHAAQAERLVAEFRPGPVFAGGRGVALVEDQVDDLEHRCQPSGALAGRRDLERNLLAGQGPLGPDDPLGDGRLGGQERTGDLVGGQAAEQPQRERDPGLGGQHGVARDEHQAQQVVLHRVVIERGAQAGRAVEDRGFLLDPELVTELADVALEPLIAP
jgi:hypothetical protein